ncbi:MAG: GAF domain-containing protein [Deltaproteobacteria bacterium]|nr:GAF domain-containing protein [Deltaproteobacteria bacterium]
MIRQIRVIYHDEYGVAEAKLDRLFSDIKALYAGKWPEYEACQVGYHNIKHCLAVALATARMTCGWNRTKDGRRALSRSAFLAGLAASLLHDSGYLKEKNDCQGRGGKYTFSHVGRSKKIARDYLTKTGWSKPRITLVCRIIATTEFGAKPDLAIFKNDEHRVMAQMVASADLIAQMADINYIRRLHDLHDEFLEAYDSEGRDKLRQRDVHVYESFREMLDATPEFYENFVLPRLKLFGRMDNYLVAFFAGGRNPYLESITANISGQLLSNRVPWQRLGDILQEQDLVDQETISEALSRQQQAETKTLKQKKRPDLHNIGQQMLDWLRRDSSEKTRLGDILMEMQAVDAKALRSGLLSQLLPEKLTSRLSRAELLNLLRLSLLGQNLRDSPVFFAQLLDMTATMLHSQSGSLLLVNRKKNELRIAIHRGPRKEQLEGLTIPIDKGLAGWVFRHAKPAFVSKSAMADLAWENSYPDGEEIDSILAVPLHINGDIIGAVEVINKDNSDFNDHDADLLTLAANVIACCLADVVRGPKADG